MQSRWYIPKSKLIQGAYYKGNCRNASYARWNGKVFIHWRYKFGHKFLEAIHCPEDETRYDVFYAEVIIDEPTPMDERIPLE